MAKNEKKSDDCARCNGSGAINFGPICQACDGSGKVAAVVPVEEPAEAAE